MCLENGELRLEPGDFVPERDDLRYRMQGAAFLGAFFHCSHLMAEHELTEERLFEGTFSEMSGDEAREQRIAMLGDSQYFTGEYADRHLQVAQIEYDYTVGEDGGMFSGAAGDESASLQINYQALQTLLAEVGGGDAGNAFDEEGNFRGDDAQYARYTELCAIIGINAANHRARQDSITTMITTA